MSVANKNDNLITPQELNSRLTPEQRKINTSKAGKASARARKKKKDMKEMLTLLLELDVKSEKVKEELKKTGIKEKEMTNQMALMVSVLNKAMRGDMKAVTFVRDTIGEKPIERAEVETKSTEASLLAEIVGQMKNV